jgi:trk system potassium uptake protein
MTKASDIAARAAATSRRAGRLGLRHWRRMSPPLFLVSSFALLIVMGTAGLLFLPGLYHDDGLGVLDALFTATSAVCVTGLIVVDTATYFTFWGQLWLLVLIQLGGIGIVTLTSMIIGALGRRLSLRAELSALPGRRYVEEIPVWRLAADVARFTLIAELIGAVLLLLLWLPHFRVHEAIWHAIFHAISAFCNAGFSTFSDSLEGMRESPVVLWIISVLIVIGGIGYLALRETKSWLIHRARGARHPRLSTHTFAVLITSGALLAFGTVFFLFLEWNGVLGELSLSERMINGWFMSVTARTAGFNTVPMDAFGNDAAFLTILLMFVGGSPGSTAGGLKTTTFAVLVALGWARIHARKHVEIHGRGIPEETRERAVGLTLMAFFVLTVAFFLFNLATPAFESPTLEHAVFLSMAFETISAFSTVGLSMGATEPLGAGGKLVLILLMFIGRVGLFSFISAILLRRRRRPKYRPAREDLVVG